MGWYGQGRGTLAALVTPPQIVTNSLPNATENQSYSFQLSAINGNPPYTFTIVSGQDGNGFPTCSVGGLVSGTPTGVETLSLVFKVTDSMNLPSAPASLSLSVTGVFITTSSLPTATQGTPYSTTLAASGGTPPYSWSMSPSTEDGLTLSSAGVLSGSATSVGSFSPTFTVTDSLGVVSAPVTLTLTVQAQPTFSFYISASAASTSFFSNGFGTLANPASILTLNDSASRSLYAGTRIGLMDGTYGLYSLCQNMPLGSSVMPVGLGIQGGISASPTVIAAVNPRKAILDAHSVPGTRGSGYPTNQCAMIGCDQFTTSGTSLVSSPGYVTLDGLVVTGSYGEGISFIGTYNGQPIPGYIYGNQFEGGIPGIVVQNCEVVDCSGDEVNNPALVHFRQLYKPLLYNCLLHGMQPADGGDAIGIGSFYCWGNKYENNTVYDCNDCLYDKNGWGGNQTLLNNYFEMSSSAVFPSGGMLMNDCRGGYVGDTLTAQNNIFVVINVTGGTPSWRNFNTTVFGGVDGPATPTGGDFYPAVQSETWINNTFVSIGSGQSGGTAVPLSGSLVQGYVPGGQNSLLTMYNNIFFSDGSPLGLVDVLYGDAVSVMDYNGYRCGNTSQTVHALTRPSAYQSAFSTLTPYSLAGFKTASGLETHGFQDTTNTTATQIFQNPISLNPAGYKLIANGLYSGTGSTNGTSGGAACDMGAWGGANPPSQIGCNFTATPTSATLASQPYPRLALQALNGSNYTNSTYQTTAGLFNVVCLGAYAGIEQSQGKTMAQVQTAIATTAVANGINSWQLQYTMSSEQSTVGGGGNASTYTVWSSDVNTTNWWIRTSYPSGTIVTHDTNSGDLAITSQNSITDSNSRTIGQAYSYHYDEMLRLGGGVSLGYSSSVSFASNPVLAGYQFDNMFCQPREAGAWGMNATSYAAGNSTAAAWMQQGQASQVAAMRSQFPGCVIMGNVDYYVHANGNFSTSVTLDPTQNGLLDLVYCQYVIGESFSIEGQGSTTTAQVIANLTAAEAQIATGGSLILEQGGQSHSSRWSNASQSSWTTADWQAARFGCAMAHMRNWYFALSATSSYAINNIYLMDEFGPQAGNRAWLGQPVDGPQSASRIQGVWYRVFQNGVVFMNPAGNGTQTINLTTLGLTGYSAISSLGFGDTSINTGATVTSITLQARDGRFLIA